ncbi:serine protease [Candidatus Finniella inopinata]|uniref:Serine protease n=1 Tax=Candidatus Finniella inopinata TaxID=1696036 RepID=A0A4Q7DI78_9PROT|nr:serine protease [Candidatus Finniella inopinata]RZI46050.1 serine protease [Candidatus Finniella inopinata]
MRIFKHMTGAVIGLLMASPLMASTPFAAPQAPTPSPQPSAPMAEPENDKSETDKKDTSKFSDRRKLLDTIRQGVVIIKTKAQIGGSGDAASWSGTGFIIHLGKGLIATNHHVVGNTVCTYEIKFSDGTTAPAKLAYFDPLHDFAFLRVDPEKLPKKSLALELSDQSPKVNDTVYSMGNSANDEFSTFKGTVFSIYENMGPFSDQSFRFSGLTVGGASGSPVFSEDGKVVGIICGGKFVSGAALPIQYVKDALKYVQEKTTPPRYSIGTTLTYGDLRDSVEAGLIPSKAAEEYLTAFPEANNKVLIVDSRAAGSEALTKLEGGDIIWKIDGQLIGPELYKFEAILNQSKVKDTSILENLVGSGKNREITLHVYRGGQLKEIKITPYVLTTYKQQHFIRFAGATWFADNEQSRLMIGDLGPSVYMSPSDSVSPFKELLSNMPLFPSQPIKITAIEGYKLTNLEDLEKAIKAIKSKRILVVKYVDLIGTLGFDAMLLSDRLERQGLVKYQAEFDTPKFYRFDTDKEQWGIQEIK